MSYIVLARKYRPKTFKEVIGQETPIAILESFISNNSIPHALIFCGSRGIGKTSMARIFAKAINSNEISEDSDIASDIDNGKCLDVIEIDAASNNGVDQIREVIEISNYSPIKCSHKVFIIDEVHMLSKAAFNALLKTLEEPNKNTVFILATTEVEKIPLTISSRCQVINFKSLNAEKLNNLIETVCSNEKIIIDNDSINLISQEANGSARDSLSILELLSNSLDSEISFSEAIKKLGIAPKNKVIEITKEILDSNTKKALEIISEIRKSGLDSKKFINQILYFIRNIIYSKLNVDTEDSSVEILNDKVLAEFENYNLHEIENIFDNLINSYERIYKSSNSDVLIETTIIKLCLISDYFKIEDLNNNNKSKAVSTDSKKKVKKTKSNNLRKNLLNKDVEPNKSDTINGSNDTNLENNEASHDNFNFKENKDRLFESKSIKNLFENFDCRILEVEKEN